MRLSHVMDIFSRKSQRNQRQRAAASSRIAACAFPSFPLFSSFCSFFLSHKKEMLEMRFPQPLLDNSDIKWRTNGDKTISCCFSSCPRCAQNFCLEKNPSPPVSLEISNMPHTLLRLTKIGY